MGLKLIKRNLKIAMQDKMGIFFSFLGVLISLFIYIFFLRDNLLDSVSLYHNAGEMVDLWMMGSLISISAITTTLASFSQKLNDYRTHQVFDFTVNEGIGLKKLDLLYIVTTVIQSVILVTIFTIIVFIYLATKYSNIFSIQKLMAVELASLLLIIFSALFFNFITNFLKSTSSFTSLSAIVGTLTGFLSGSYIPYGSLPKVVQKVVSNWVGYQNAACIRYLLNKDLNFPSFVKKDLFKNLGIATSVHPFINCLLVSLIVIIVLNVIMQKKRI